MSKKVNEILKENSELKKELEGILELIKENEIKNRGFKVIEYAFLLANSLDELIDKPLKYLEDIFEIDKAAIFIDREKLPFDRDSDNIDNSIFFVDKKVFKYFFLEKRVYSGVGKTNFISEFDIYPKMNSYLISPIIENDTVIGSLNLYSIDPKKFIEKKSTDFIKDLSFKISITLRKLFNSEKLAKQMLIDFSTNCYNKLALYNFLQKFINMLQRYEKPFAFAILDIDNFKEVNDTKGHLTGDEFLKKFAHKLLTSFRKSDIVGRFGGDEFYMILPEANHQMMEGVSRKIQEIVYELKEGMDLPDNLGISGGFMLFEDKKIDLTPEDILKLTDDLLYKCKKGGKGKIDLEVYHDF